MPDDGDEGQLDELAARRRFDGFIAPHLPSLRARAAQLCRSHHDADDILQQALLRAFLAKTQLSNPQRARSWLLVILTNTFIDEARKRRRRPEHVELEVELPAPEPGEPPPPWDEISPDDLRAAIDELPDDVRETYRMFALEGRDYAAIAEALAVPTTTVGTRLFRARRKLRALLSRKQAP